MALEKGAVADLGLAERLEAGQVLDQDHRLAGLPVQALDRESGQVEHAGRSAKHGPQLLMRDLVQLERTPDGAIARLRPLPSVADPGAHHAAWLPDPAGPFLVEREEDGHGAVVPSDDALLVCHENEGVGLIHDSREFLPLAVEDAEVLVEGLEPALVPLGLVFELSDFALADGGRRQERDGRGDPGRRLRIFGSRPGGPRERHGADGSRVRREQHGLRREPVQNLAVRGREVRAAAADRLERLHLEPGTERLLRSRIACCPVLAQGRVAVRQEQNGRLGAPAQTQELERFRERGFEGF